MTAFGDAAFYGQAQRNDVTGIAALPNGKGYWIVTKNGAVQAFGQAKTYPGKVPSGSDIVGIASSRDGAGYLLVGEQRVRDRLRRRPLARVARTARS